jgi:Double zinc ribbon
MTERPLTCQKCGSPVKPGMKFCESCGAKIEAGPACPHCGAPLVPNVKFCESCGKPVVAAAPAAPAETPPAALSPETSRPADTAAPIKEVKQPEVKPEPVPEDKPAAPAVKVETAPAKQVAKETPKESGPKKPIAKTTLIIAGVIVLAVLGAAVYFVVLPMMSGGGSTPAGGNAPSLPGFPSGTVEPTSTQAPVQSTAPSTAQVSFVTEPTQVPPANLLVTFQADRDAITGIVTVTFTGGAGRYGVKNVDIRLTRSDGQVITKTVTIAEIGQGMTLQGSKTGDDRIEITANYNNGEHYKIIDRILEYTRRNW